MRLHRLRLKNFRGTDERELVLPTSGEVEQHIIDLRQRTRRGPDWLGAELGLPARTVSRVLARHKVPRSVDFQTAGPNHSLPPAP